ncbi:MAG: alpha/beta fold hydrolase [Gammaproteobacteria bacterium]|nr:alpha/beta fold hydrolase [Gammaproteobacteria bacterium]
MLHVLKSCTLLEMEISMAKNGQTLKLEHHLFEPLIHEGLPDIVMLHGICAGAWVFPRAFIEPLLDQGYRVHTLSYRGHGESEGRDRINHWRLSDYVSDVKSILEELPEQAIVIGHSLGTAIAQILIRDNYPMAGVVLMSPVPPRGLSSISLRMLWSDPIAYQQLAIALTVGVHHVSERVGARLLFSKTEITDEVRWFFSQCCDESPWLALDLQGMPRIAPPTYDRDSMPPVLVVSGQDDRLIRPVDASEAGHFYQTDVHWVPGGSHMLMYDAASDEVSGWIGNQIKRILKQRSRTVG